MKTSRTASKLALAFGFGALFLGLSAQPASAAWPWTPRRTVVVSPYAYPAYTYPAPVRPVYVAPVARVIAPPIRPIYAAPVPTVYTTPAVIAAPARARMVYPRPGYVYPY